MVSREHRFQLNQAKARQKELAAIAIRTEKYPDGRETINAAGLKTRAPIKQSDCRVVLGSGVFLVRVEHWKSSIL
jgi:hypothetical protein